MFDADALRAFLVDYEDQLQAAVSAYYDDIAQAEGPKTGLSRLLQPVNIGLTRLIARQTIAETLKNILTRMHLDAAKLGNEGSPIDAGQHLAALDAIDTQMAYLDNFLKDLPDMPRAAALTRIVKYVNAAVQTISDSATVHMPHLPHYPGDYDLACHGFCRCHLEVVRRGPGNWDVYWMLDPEGLEHCIDCVDLARAWSPLMIRNGEIVAVKAKHDDTES